MHWRAFPLHPETPPEGRSLAALFAGRPVDIPAMLTRLKHTANDLGLPFGERHMTYNSRRAQELGKWAERKGLGHAFHKAVFHAYFAKGRNIARLEVLTDIVQSVGGDPEEARSVIQMARYKEMVDLDWERSRRIDITAVPTFVLNERHLVGAHPYRDLARFVAADK